MVYPAISRDSVLLPAPDPPMMAVSVPGRAVSEMSSSSCLPSIDDVLDVAHLQAAGAGRGLGAADQVAVGEHQVDVADGDHVALGQDRRPDPGAVDERPVDAVVSRISVPSGVGTKVA